jgi:hypothetical protein
VLSVTSCPEIDCGCVDNPPSLRRNLAASIPLTMASLSRSETWSLLALFGACSAVLGNTFQGDGAPLVASLAFSGVAFASTFAFVRWSGPSFMKAGLKGKDLGKAIPKEM